MAGTLADADTIARFLLGMSARLALGMAAVVVVERVVSALVRARREWVEDRYRPLVASALAADDAAAERLVAAPSRHHLPIIRLLVEPLVDDRDPNRIARTREVVRRLPFVSIADRYLRSWLWWRRAVALRAVGVLQLRDRTAEVVAALDDQHADVRAAALDALTYLRDPSSLTAIVVRLHDASLEPARRFAALSAFGPESEEFLLELSKVDAAHLVNYAQALAICGTARSRPLLSQWTRDSRTDVRAAAFEALAHVGVDADAAGLAIAAMNSDDEAVRAMAAHALNGWTGSGDAAVRLGQHLDDAWPVAVRAAQSLRSMGAAGTRQLQAQASRSDLAGLLARKMLSPIDLR